jgi:hypothetical protein
VVAAVVRRGVQLPARPAAAVVAVVVAVYQLLTALSHN